MTEEALRPEPPGVQRRGRQQGLPHPPAPRAQPGAPRPPPSRRRRRHPPSWRAPRTPLPVLGSRRGPSPARSHAAATPLDPTAVASYRFADPGAAALPAPDGRLAEALLGHRGAPEPAAAASAAASISHRHLATAVPAPARSRSRSPPRPAAAGSASPAAPSSSLRLHLAATAGDAERWSWPPAERPCPTEQAPRREPRAPGLGVRERGVRGRGWKPAAAGRGLPWGLAGGAGAGTPGGPRGS